MDSAIGRVAAVGLVAWALCGGEARAAHGHCDETDAWLVYQVGAWGWYLWNIGATDSRLASAMAHCQARLYDGNDLYDDEGNSLAEVPDVICEEDLFTLGLLDWVESEHAWWLDTAEDQISLRDPDGEWHELEVFKGGMKRPPPQWVPGYTSLHTVARVGPLEPGLYTWRWEGVVPPAPSIGKEGAYDLVYGDILVLPHAEAH